MPLAPANAPTSPLPPAAGLQLLPGFHAEVYFAGLSHPTAMAAGPDGRLWVAEEAGTVVVLDPGATPPHQAMGGLRSPLGLAFMGRRVFVTEQGRIETATVDGQNVSDRRVIVDGLPFGLHQQDGLAVGADGRLYVGSGSTCDVCDERDPRSAAVLSMRPDGGDLQVLASGLRNPFGLAFQPGQPRLYASVNGQDHLDLPGDPEPADMVVAVSPGARYGWPVCWPSARTLQLTGACTGITAPAVYMGPHASADGLLFYQPRSFPPAYAGNLFVAEWGQYLTTSGPGHRVARIVLGPDGTAPVSAVSVFADGFAHPLALAEDTAGALLVADYGRGVIYRIQADGAP